ncbi:hypothetical protein GS416_11190 [Rhodococcus hoagii]|nr:hypothetical protein [Prescottella equi]
MGPSTAIMTPGAASLIPEGYETEPVEYLAQTVLEMCTLPARSEPATSPSVSTTRGARTFP